MGVAYCNLEFNARRKKYDQLMSNRYSLHAAELDFIRCDAQGPLATST
jgi:hypothetical protein